jgi:hypothetical protein
MSPLLMLSPSATAVNVVVPFAVACMTSMLVGADEIVTLNACASAGTTPNATAAHAITSPSLRLSALLRPSTQTP